MTIELIQEQIAHLETRRALWNTQQQLLSLLMQKSDSELATLQAQLRDAKATPALPDAPS
jgi:hypothetical protein